MPFACLLAAAAGAPQTALAQDRQARVMEEVVVTGSRIRDPNVISSSQVATVDMEDISDRGITRVEDYLNDLPQISPGQAITASNGSSGTATVNVRNLGCERTLVLINGQRLAPGTTGGGNCADLNAIPALLLERVEVLTGGASSVYGSDAVAGVVNFILNEDFEGFRASYMHSFYQHSNDNGALRDLVRSYDYELADDSVTTGRTDKLAAAFGGSILGGRGHLTGFAEKTDTGPILQADYDISACALTRGKSGCGGSSTIPPGRWGGFRRLSFAWLCQYGGPLGHRAGPEGAGRRIRAAGRTDLQLQPHQFLSAARQAPERGGSSAALKSAAPSKPTPTCAGWTPSPTHRSPIRERSAPSKPFPATTPCCPGSSTTPPAETGPAWAAATRPTSPAGPRRWPTFRRSIWPWARATSSATARRWCP